MEKKRITVRPLLALLFDQYKVDLTEIFDVSSLGSLFSSI